MNQRAGKYDVEERGRSDRREMEGREEAGEERGGEEYEIKGENP